MANLKVEASPQTLARIGGLLYLIIIVAGIFSVAFVRARIIVPGDVSTTASNIISSEHLWRMGISGDLIMHICDVPLMLIFYVLFRPVNRNLALLALLFNLVQTAVMVATELNLLSPLFLLGDAESLKAFDLRQLQALAYIPLKLNDYGFGFGLIFFGCTCILNGYLIFKSEYLPRTLGVLMQIAGYCYLINSFVLVLAPSLAHKIFPAILLPSFVGELSLCLWLIVKGVNLLKWNKMVGVEQVQ
jgi:hypothetical protein